MPEFPSQSPSPALHVLIPHTPLTQFGVPPALGHTVPHVPQWLTFVFVFVSHPLFASPSQLAVPPLHTGVQTPATQLVVPFPLLHVTPHAPQLLTFVAMFVSQPLFLFPSQFAQPAAHTGSHVPPTQLVVPCAFEHPIPHDPQSLTLVFRFASHLLLPFPSQFPKLPEHVGTHAPATHTVLPFAFVHAAPQLPQFVVVPRDASHPFAMFPSQSSNPALQLIVHALLLHPALPLLLEHAAPHPPQ